MPYIDLKTTAKVTKEKEIALKAAFGKAIELIPGKSERWLMVRLADECKMFLAGDNKDEIAMVEIDIFGSAADAAYDALTERACDILNEELSIKKDKIYVKYREVDHWGWNGENF
ncbi:MAG: hypothetical protein IKV20_04895 [Clostridia bacterium]|nr:hypothetical protein [Clostridia bacterium]